MKKVFLLLTAGIFSLSAIAQERLNNSVVFSATPQVQRHPVGRATKSNSLSNLFRTTRTTSTGQSRWYNYMGYIDTSTGGADANFSMFLWNDTSSADMYYNGSGFELDHNTMVSISTIVDPYFSQFDNTGYYDSSNVGGNGVLFLGNWKTMNYTVDSLGIYGIFGFNPAKTSIVDTITIGYTYGTGTGTSDISQGYFTSAGAPDLFTDYGVPTSDSMWIDLLLYDSVTNTGAGTNFAKQTILVSASGATTNSSAKWGDTLADGTFFKKIGLNTPLSVPAGDIVGVTISFKSGDPAAPTATTHFGDTVFTGDAAGTTFNEAGNFRYNMFMPYVGYITTSATSTTPTWPTYPSTPYPNASTTPLSGDDFNSGLFKELPNYTNGWDNVYVPQWAWSAQSSTGTPEASSYQYPIVDVHVQCATCIDANAVPVTAKPANVITAYPNPSANQLNITFNVNTTADVSVSLTNVIGQVVATQNINNVTNGKAVFNTAALADGMYIYTVLANGERTTGHVVIAH